MVSQQDVTGTARADAARHSLDPLSIDEISQAVAIFRADGRARPAMRFVSVSLHEPPKSEVALIRPGQAFRREAFIVALDPREHMTYEAVVSVTEGSVLSWRPVPGARAPITPGEYAESERLVRADPRFRAGLQRRVHLVRGLMRVRAQSVRHPGHGSGSPGGLLVPVAAVVVVVLTVVRGVRMRVAHASRGCQQKRIAAHR